MVSSHRGELERFATENVFRGQGPLSVALVVTQHAKELGLPLDPAKLVTGGGGQVLGLGKGAVQAVLKRHGIDRVFAKEGGRTSCGSLGNMREYVAVLNALAEKGKVDLDGVEAFWVERVREFFAGKPFKIKLDVSRSLRTVVRDVIVQAEERQRNAPGMNYAGAVLQHLVGAKLDCALGKGSLKHNSFSTADAPGNRAGDFLLGDVAIHVTTSPGEALELASRVGLGERVDVFEIEQFVALNLYELAKVAADGRKTAVTDLVNRYNEIVGEVETDPSLKIELRR
jgi:hypothetical protein